MVKTTFLKSTLLPYQVLWEMLEAAVQTNRTESAVDGSYQNSSVLHKEKNKKESSTCRFSVWIYSRSSADLEEELQLNVCLNHMLKFKSDVIENNIWTEEAKASKMLFQLCRKKNTPF